MNSPKNIECLTGTLALAQGAVGAGVRRFIGIGTCAEYDSRFGFLSIDTPLNPKTPYAASKAAAYIALSQILPSLSVEFAWCRLFYLYGEGEDSRRLLPYLRENLSKGNYVEITGGNKIRDYLNVAEAGRRVAQIALGGETGSFNICSGNPVTLKQISEMVADEFNRRDLLRFGGDSKNNDEPPCIVGIRG